MQATIDEINALAQVAAAEDREPANHKAPAHPYQTVGLGRAPFECVAIHIDEDMETRCAYCNTALKYCYRVREAGGNVFTVGCECIKQIDGAVAGFEKFNRQMQGRIADIRKKAREAKAAAALKKAVELWGEEYPKELKLIQEKAATGSGFYMSLSNSLQKWGALTPNQLAAVQRDMAREATQRAQQAAQTSTGRATPATSPAPAPAVTLEPVHAAFERATAAGIVHPRLRLGEFVFTPAKATSANPGAIYVKTAKGADGEQGAYLGKVIGGKFLRSRDCSSNDQDAIVELARDPKAAAIAYGKKYGRCSVCARPLTDAESVEAGIGPICAKRYGF